MAIGRPTKLTKARKTRIIDAISIGSSLEIAARAGGVTYYTLRNWRLRGKEIAEKLEALGEDEELVLSKDDSMYLNFFNELEAANIEASQIWLSTIFSASTDDPSWAAWMLAKRFPDDYGASQKLIGAGTDGAVKIEIVEVIKDRGDDDTPRE